MNRLPLAIVYLGCTVTAVIPQSPAPPTSGIVYRIEAPVAGAGELKDRFTTSQIAVLEVLNRADVAHLHRLDALLVPESWHEDRLQYSPFPTNYGWGAARGRLLVVDKPAQAFAAYEAGTLVRWGPVSTGRDGLQTPSGLFHLTWRSRGRHSTVDPDWFMPWYFNFHNDRGISFHEFTLPGRPASHACVRMLERDARWLFEWGETWTLDDRGWTVLDPGTPVLILGCHAFNARPPWRSPEWLAAGIRMPADPVTEPYSCR
jgi:hypothetical protein